MDQDYNIDILNIPAYQRKKSLAQKARAKTSAPHLRTRKTKAKRPYRPAEHLEIAARDIPTPAEDFAGLPKRSASKKVREMKRCGICEGYFEKINVAVIRLTAPLREGERVLCETQDGLFEQTIDSIQIDRKQVKLAVTGSEIGIKTLMKPQVGGAFYKVIE